MRKNIFFRMLCFSWLSVSWPVTAVVLAQTTRPEITPEKTARDEFTIEETEKQLREHIHYLAERIGERNLLRIDSLNRAAEYCQSVLEQAGWQMHRQTYQVQGIECQNLETQRLGRKFPNDIVLIGAHYDSARGTPGANDNATGVAALLVMSKALSDTAFDRTVRFVLFTNEEPPYFQREAQMGSWVYARRCREKNENIVLVLSLETIGFYSDEPNSQKYPPLLASLYPSTGNFLGFVSNVESKSTLDKIVTRFRIHSKIPAFGAALPSDIPGVGWSDHWSFWQEGYPGIMVTDTAPFRYPHYHRSTDTPDKLEFGRYSQVVDGLIRLIREFANETQSLP